MPKPYEENEIVKIIGKDKSLSKIYGKDGTIICVNYTQNTGKLSYTVSIDGICWRVYPDEIEATGRFDMDDHLTNVIMKVCVTPKGEGILKEVIIQDEEEKKDL